MTAKRNSIAGASSSSKETLRSPKSIFDAAKHLFDCTTWAELADETDISASAISLALRNPDRLSKTNSQKLLHALNRVIAQQSGGSIVEADLFIEDLATFVGKLGLPDEKRNSLLAALNLPFASNHSIEDSILEKLNGVWAVFYMCRDASSGDKPAVAAATFNISVVNGKPTLRETSHDKGAPLPIGSIRIRHNTIEIDLDYQRADLPIAKYMATIPVHREVRGLILTSLDIKGRDSTVVARPILMVRVEKDAQHPKQFNSKTPIFKAVSTFLTKFSRYDELFMEIVRTREPDIHEYDDISRVIELSWQEYLKRIPSMEGTTKEPQRPR